MINDTLKKAINSAYSFCEEQQNALDSGKITEEQWFDIHNKHFTEIYLRTDNPLAQSGHGGNDERYRYTQGMILEALYREGTFIDIGCANGYLVEKLAQWTSTIGYGMRYYGLDISEELLLLAKRRLPALSDNFFPGNALYWTPPRTFDYVCIRELAYVPAKRQKDLFVHLYDDVLSSNGRLILGPLTELENAPGLIADIGKWGYSPDGYCFKSHQDHGELVRRLYWFDKARRHGS